MRLLYREGWKVILDGKPLVQASAAVTGEIAEHYEYMDSAAAMAEIQTETLQDLERLYALAQQGHTLTMELIGLANQCPPPVGRIQALGKSLGELDEQIRILGVTKDTLKPITATFRFGKENLQGWELLSLAQQTLQLYADLAHQTRTITQMLTECLEDLPSRLWAVECGETRFPDPRPSCPAGAGLPPPSAAA
jgi:hypothetical protein